MNYEDLTKKLTASEFECCVDKIVVYSILLDEITTEKYTDTEKSMYGLINNFYPLDIVVTNSYVFADYFGFCRCVKALFPKLRQLLIAEADLYMELLLINNPDIDVMKIKTD